MGGFDRRKLLGLVAGVGAAGLTSGLSACGSSPTEKPKSPIKIGLLIPQTGRDTKIGQEMQQGFQLYLDLHDGELGGHKVDLRLADETDNPENAVKALNGLLKESVVAVVGIANPDALRKAAPIVTEPNVQVPLLATHASPADMTSSVYVWRTSFVTKELGQAIGIHFKRRGLSPGDVAAIGIGDASGTEILQGFTDEFSNNVKSIVVPSAGSSLGGYVDELMNRSYKAVFCYLPPELMPNFYKALGSRTANVYAPGTVSEGKLLKALPEQAKGLFTAMQYSPDLNNPANRVFAERFDAKYKETPSAYAVAAYDAAAVLDRAVSLIGDDMVSSQRINAELSKVGLVVSPRGNWQFTTPRNPQQKWYLRQIRNDGPVTSNVLIEDLATLG